MLFHLQPEQTDDSDGGAALTWTWQAQQRSDRSDRSGQGAELQRGLRSIFQRSQFRLDALRSWGPGWNQQPKPCISGRDSGRCQASRAPREARLCPALLKTPIFLGGRSERGAVDPQGSSPQNRLSAPRDLPATRTESLFS